MRTFLIVFIGLLLTNPSFASMMVKCDFNGQNVSYVAETKNSSHAEKMGQFEITISTTENGIFYLAVTNWNKDEQIRPDVPDTVASSFGASANAHLSSKYGTLSCNSNEVALTTCAPGYISILDKGCVLYKTNL